MKSTKTLEKIGASLHSDNPPVAVAPPTPRVRSIRTSMNYSTDHWDIYEYPYGKSLTAPNQVYSPQEMLDRFTRGIPLDTSAQQPYYSDIELPDLDRMDLSEIADLREENNEILRKAEEDRTKKEKEEIKRLEKEQLRKELEEENNSTPSNPSPKDPPPLQ